MKTPNLDYIKKLSKDNQEIWLRIITKNNSNIKAWQQYIKGK